MSLKCPSNGKEGPHFGPVLETKIHKKTIRKLLRVPQTRSQTVSKASQHSFQPTKQGLGMYAFALGVPRWPQGGPKWTEAPKIT